MSRFAYTRKTDITTISLTQAEKWLKEGQMSGTFADSLECTIVAQLKLKDDYLIWVKGDSCWFRW